MYSPDGQRLRNKVGAPASRRLLFASFALPSGALSAVLPLAISPTVNLGVFAPAQPLGPPLYFALALCFGLYQETPPRVGDVLKIFVGIFISWTAAYQVAYLVNWHLTVASSSPPSRFEPQIVFIKHYVMAIAGLLAGAIGGLGTAICIATVQAKLPHRLFLTRTIAVGAAAGAVLQMPEPPIFPPFVTLYLTWQTAVAWSVSNELADTQK